jgi:hypothetical protein
VGKMLSGNAGGDKKNNTYTYIYIHIFPKKRLPETVIIDKSFWKRLLVNVDWKGCRIIAASVDKYVVGTG